MPKQNQATRQSKVCLESIPQGLYIDGIKMEISGILGDLVMSCDIFSGICLTRGCFAEADT